LAATADGSPAHHADHKVSDWSSGTHAINVVTNDGGTSTVTVTDFVRASTADQPATPNVVIDPPPGVSCTKWSYAPNGGYHIAALGYSTIETTTPATGCKLFHWNKPSRTNEVVVTLQDTTPAGWPVTTVAADWDTTSGIQANYSWQTCSWNCIRVSLYYADNLTAGYTNFAVNSSTGEITGASIWLNTKFAGSSSHNQSTICHEVGHSLGLDHWTGDPSASCMADGRPGLHPAANDRSSLSTLLYPMS
jgi:hypothetical protein